jgi:hypothetical protein
MLFGPEPARRPERGSPEPPSRTPPAAWRPSRRLTPHLSEVAGQSAPPPVCASSPCPAARPTVPNGLRRRKAAWPPHPFAARQAVVSERPARRNHRQDTAHPLTERDPPRTIEPRQIEHSVRYIADADASPVGTAIIHSKRHRRLSGRYCRRASRIRVRTGVGRDQKGQCHAHHHHRPGALPARDGPRPPVWSLYRPSCPAPQHRAVWSSAPFNRCP